MWSGGDRDAAFGFGGGEAAVAVIAVAVGDVAGEREREGVPAWVVGVGDDELGERREVAFDGVQIAGVCGVGTSSMLWPSAKDRMSGVQLADRLSWIQ